MQTKILNKNSIVLLLIVMMVSCFQTGKVSAQENVLFQIKRLDTNGDGLISRSEFDNMRKKIFANIDSDGNGVITQDEIASRQGQIAMRAELRQVRLALAASRMDMDSNGSITTDEMENAPYFFKLLDRNDDESISPEEMSIFRESVGLKLN